MNKSTCLICGTADPHGGVQYAYRGGEPVGVICAYRLGCVPGVTRPTNG